MNPLLEPTLGPFVASPWTWALAAVVCAVVEVFIPTGFLLALAIAAGIVMTAVWGAEAVLSEAVRSTLHWTWPVVLWAVITWPAFFAVRRMARRRGETGDVNEY